MAATLHPIEDSDPPEVAVVDSSFVFEAVIDPRKGDGRHERSAAFADRMLAQGTTLVHSSLIQIEATQCWGRLRERGVLSPIGEGNEAIRWANAYVAASAKVDKFLGRFDTWEVEIRPDVLALANRHAAQYQLKSHDALLLAIGTTVGVRNIISLDKDFRDVDHIDLWALGPST